MPVKEMLAVARQELAEAVETLQERTVIARLEGRDPPGPQSHYVLHVKCKTDYIRFLERVLQEIEEW